MIKFSSPPRLHGKHGRLLVLIPYERIGNGITPVTIHATTRQQIKLQVEILNASSYIRDAVMETVQAKMLKLSEAGAA